MQFQNCFGTLNREELISKARKVMKRIKQQSIRSVEGLNLPKPEIVKIILKRLIINQEKSVTRMIFSWEEFPKFSMRELIVMLKN